VCKATSYNLSAHTDDMVKKMREETVESEFVTIKVITSPTCPYCPQAVKLVRELAKNDSGIIAVELPITTSRGYQEAVKFGISGVPSLIINDRHVVHGLPSKEKLLMAIEMERR